MIATNLQSLRVRINEKCTACNREPEEIKLIAVSKFFGIDAIQEANGLGITDFGENKAQELRDKYEILGDKVTWHFIGTLQRNKVKYAVKAASYIHSVDSSILADEINRTPPKTQAALLEAMQENKVTAAGVTYQLPQPFFVLATQNPIEQEGTYPLPEAQLDRFMFNLWLEYPTYEEEIKIVETTTSEYKAKLDKVLSANEIMEFQDLVRKVPVAENVIEFAVKVSNMTRPTNGNSPQFIKDWITWGAGPRASQYMILSAKTRAIINGRYTPNIEDVKLAMLPVLRHRIITNFSAEAEGIKSVDVIEKLGKEF